MVTRVRWSGAATEVSSTFVNNYLMPGTANTKKNDTKSLLSRNFQFNRKDMHRNE